MNACTSLYDELKHYGKFLSEIELDTCIHQRFYEYKDKKYAVTLKNGNCLFVCEFVWYNYSLGALRNRRGDM